MSREPDTGVSTRDIIAGANRDAWNRVRPLLEAGGKLTRPSGKIPKYFVGGYGGLTPAFVEKLVREGVLEEVGAQTYKLAGLIA